ncbi:glutamate 5-kinase [Salsipaludibacter albus]|uniref:glutamate 5-kinase n=1 Tax=Salsipaludibacter albus TaxID=2849650 RepID=UPI001EE3AD0E|nr:glutamate 5-kinase [Salsipaludibacter albus]MBY5162244.1 glutamate 5-kinase [Salsipaludibacter albus]
MAERPGLVVVKVGSSSLRGPDGLLDRSVVARLGHQLARVRADGSRVVLVSSGAVSAGMGLLGLHHRPRERELLQACAAVGQAELINAYQHVFDDHGLSAAQVLLTQDDFVGRGRYLGARRTLRRLLELETIPVINENDTIAFDELAYGDNDHLAALVASMLHADLLVVLSDVDGVHDAPPGRPGARVIPRIDDPATLDDVLVGGTGSHVGSGGMRTKVDSAQVVTSSGGAVVIANAARPDVVVDAVAGRSVGTLFPARPRASDARRLWIGFALRIRGRVVVDAGAVEALTRRGTSLLPVGVVDVDGDFVAGSCVEITGPDGVAVARGLTTLAAEDLRLIAGRSTTEAREALGAGRIREVVHRDQLFVFPDHRAARGDA